MSTSSESGPTGSSPTESVPAAAAGDPSTSASEARVEPGQPALDHPVLDYKALARFLLRPLTDLPDALQVSSETTAQNKKVSLRVSLGQADRGRAFGRGGRNIRAIRTILRAAGRNAGQTVSLEIVGGDGKESGNRPKPKPRRAGEPRPARPKPKPKR